MSFLCVPVLAYFTYTPFVLTVMEESVLSGSSVSQQQQRDILILRIKGSVDLSLVISLENAVLGAIRLGKRKAVIDLRDVGSADPILVSSLTRIQDAMFAAGGSLRFANAPLSLGQELLVSGFRQKLSIFDTVEDVLRTFSV